MTQMFVVVAQEGNSFYSRNRKRQEATRFMTTVSSEQLKTQGIILFLSSLDISSISIIWSTPFVVTRV